MTPIDLQPFRQLAAQARSAAHDLEAAGFTPDSEMVKALDKMEKALSDFSDAQSAQAAKDRRERIATAVYDEAIRICTDEGSNITVDAAKLAVELADALIAELDKTTP